MPNLFPPKVTVKESFVELGKKLSLSSMFTVADLDPVTTITRYRFRDNSNVAASGFFTLDGVRQNAGVWIEIEASQLTSVFFQSALVISNESIGIEAFDGLHWSSSSFGSVFSVVPNIRRPLITATDASILSSEGLLVTNIVQSTDPDGYPITKYLFVDRSLNASGGFFSLNGVAQPSGAWFQVTAAELPFLRYIGGQTAGFEDIGVQTFDGALWSQIVEVTWTTTPNLFAPTVTAFDLTIPVDRVISADQLFQFLDLDGNTLKKVQFFDTGVLPTGGFFTVDGVVQTPNAWFEVNREQFGTVEYHTASTFNFERFRVRAFDGKFWSTNASAKIVSIAPPDFDVPRVLVLDAYEVRAASSVISLSGGPGITKYEVIDLSDDEWSAKWLKNGVALEENVVHALTATQFSTLDFKGGQDDRGREFDDFLIRGFNGVFWSDWTNIPVHTDAYVERALDFGADWETGPGTQELTYTFLLAIPDYYATDDDEYTGGPLPLNVTQRAKVREVLATFETLIDVDFVEVGQAPGSLGDFTFGLTDLPDGVAAWAYLPSGPGKPGDVWFDTAFFNAEQSTAEGRFVIFHEMGHALGLLHSFQEGVTDLDYLPAATENQRYTMMSYGPPNVPGRAESPMLYDVFELQKDYGGNPNYNTGDDEIQIPLNYASFRTIWDAGGNDTFDLDNQTLSMTADLREGRYSSIGGVTENVAIAYGAIIENLNAGIGDDTLFGNSVSNVIRGNDGDDRIAGLAGNDFLFGGGGNDRYDYTLGDGFDAIDEETAGGRDTLTIKGFGTFDSFTEDLSFRVINSRDLDIQLTIDGGPTQGGIIIKDMSWGGSRVETLRIQEADGSSIGPRIDLRSIFVYSTTALQKFSATEFTSQFGTLAVPV